MDVKEMKERSKMKKQFVVVIIMLVLLTVGLSGCSENGGRNKFVGTWTSAGGAWYHDIIVLYSDGIASLTHHTSGEDHVQSATWEVNDTHLILHIESYGEVTSNEYHRYSFTNDETLVLTQVYRQYVGEPTTYRKS